MIQHSNTLNKDREDNSKSLLITNSSLIEGLYLYEVSPTSYKKKTPISKNLGALALRMKDSLLFLRLE